MAARNLDKLDLALGRISSGVWQIKPEEGKIYNKTREIGFINGQGYRVVSVLPGTKVLVHVIIWEFVHGRIPQGMEINHKNGNKLDARLDNLELVTPQENSQHGHDMGLSFKWGRGEV